MFPYNNMSKIEQLHHGYRLIIDRFSDNVGIPDSEVYRISTLNNEHHYHDEITLTKDQYAELKNFFLSNEDGVIAEQFTTKEIEDAFLPRYGGVNPEFKEFCHWGWVSAFQYVNDRIREKRKEK